MKSAESLASHDDSVSTQQKSAPKIPALGGLRDQMPDHLYALTRGRRIYTSPWLQESPMRRCTASICLTTTSLPFKVTVPGRVEMHRACAIRPMVQRAMQATNVGIVSFQFEPSHPLFPRFRRISVPGTLPLDRRAFSSLNAQLDAAYNGTLNAAQAADLFEAVTTLAMRNLPRAKPIDPRVAKIIELLWERHDCPLAELAASVGLSYFRLSHLFAENVGMTLRSYQLWRKLRKATSLAKRSHTLAHIAQAAGFSNAAHFTRAFVQLHAAPPSYFLHSGNVRIISA